MTIKDIAKESGYSVGTVSRCLNHQPGVSPKAERRIKEVVEKYNFKLNANAKHLKQTVKDGIAIIIKGTQNMLFASIVEQLQKQIQAQGYVSTIYYIDENANEVEQAIAISVERNPYGFLFLGSNLDFFKKDFAEIDVPCVLVTNSGEGMGFHNLSSVSTDDIAASKFAIDHLLNLGHRKIGILGGIAEESVAAANRFKGCKQAFEEHGLTFDEKEFYIETLFSVPNGYAAMEKLLEKKNGLSAVFCMSDTMAFGAMRCIADHGLKIPEDISVIGFDGIEMGDYLSPRLTTIRQQKELLAQRSVEILLEQIKSDSSPVYETEPFHLIPGESVAPNRE